MYLLLQNLWWVFLSIAIILLYFFISYRRKYSLLKLKMDTSQKLTNKRLKIAKDLSDELSNSFNFIRIITKESDSADLQQSKENFKQVSQLCNESIELLEDILWVVSEENNTFEDLIFKVEDYVDDLLRIHGIHFEVEKRDIPMKKKVGVVLRKNFLLLFKETLNILINHTKLISVKVSFIYQPGYLKISILSDCENKIDKQIFSKVDLTKLKRLAEDVGGKLEIKNQEKTIEMKAVFQR